MRYLNRITLAATAALALTGLLGVGHASATTLEVGGVTKNESVSLEISLKSGTSGVLRDTFGFSANTCSKLSASGSTSSPFTGTIVTGSASTFSIENCEHSITVHKSGQLYVEWTSGTNGRVFSENAEITAYSTIHGTFINCKTGTGTLLGTLTGVASGQATVHINATINCGPHLSSAKLTGTGTVTSPSGLGVSP